jgi:hypothetical protein
MAFLNSAREYADAANELFIVANARPKIHGRHLPLSNPLYFLYSHATELAFKAFLEAKNRPTRQYQHKLIKLYEECCTLGLVVGKDDSMGIRNISSLLATWNTYEGSRYFNLESNARPELSWISEIIGELIRAVEPHVQADAPREAVKATLIVGKPMPKPR